MTSLNAAQRSRLDPGVAAPAGEIGVGDVNQAEGERTQLLGRWPRSAAWAFDARLRRASGIPALNRATSSLRWAMLLAARHQAVLPPLRPGLRRAT